MKPFELVEHAFLLKSTLLFQALELDQLLSLCEKMEFIEYRAQEKIFEIGQEASYLYLIVKGKIELSQPHLSQKTTLKEGDFFGDEQLLAGKKRAYQAVALQASACLCLGKMHLYALLMECPQLAIEWLKLYGCAIQGIRQQL